MKTDGKRPRKQRNREAIISRAAELFLREGFSGTSMAMIAAEVGGSKTTLYNHFPSKELLFEEVVQLVLTSVIQSVEEVDYRGLDVRAALTAIGTTIFSAAQSKKSIAVHRLVFFEAQRNGAGARAFLKRGPEVGLRYLRTALAHFVDQGSIECRDIDKAATYFFAMLLYQHMLYREAGVVKELDRTEIESHVDQVVEDFIRICPAL